MKASKKYERGARVRISLPGSKLHGLLAECVRQVPPLGWWVLKSDKPLEVGEGEEPTRELMAPELWLEPAPPRRSRAPKEPTAGVRGQALSPAVGDARPRSRKAARS